MFNKRQISKGLIFLLLETGVLFTFYYFLVGRLLPFPFSLILSILGSLFMLVSIVSFLTARAKYIDWQLMKKALNAKNITDFKDGQKVVVFGQILPTNGQPIISPFTQKKCVFYTYNIYQWVWEGYGKDRRKKKEPDYSGLHLTPSCVDSTVGKIRLLAFPTLQGFEKKTYSYSGDTVPFYNNAYAYIQNIQFEEFGRMGISKFRNAYQMVKDILTDDDGYVRKDTKYTTKPFDLKTRYLEEQYVKEGENASLLGIWSATKQGIVTDINKAVAVLTKGSPEQAIKTAKKDFFKKLREGLLVFFVINLIIGVFWWILNEGPKYGTVTFTETRNGRVVKKEIVGSTKQESKEEKSTISSEPSPTPIEWLAYSNTIGKYKYEYPSNWKHNEIVNEDLNTPDQKILSVSSSIANPDYAPMYGSLDFSYQIDGGQCIEKDESLRDWINLKTKVGDLTVDAYERQELNESVNRVIYERLIFIPRRDRCYKFLILDQQGNPNFKIFQQVLSSFKFLD